LFGNFLKILAFIKRDFLNEISYRTAFLLQLFGMLLSIFIWFFISKIISPDIEGLGGLDYFPWVLVGLAFTSYLNAALSSFARKMRSEQLTGTLEAMLATPTRMPVVIFSSAAWDFIFSSLRVVAYLVLGALLFSVTIHLSNAIPFLIIFILTILSFSGLGILSASFILYFKKGDPINFFISGVMILFGGAYFPVEALKDYPALMIISKFLPITYSLRAIRETLLKGASISMLKDEILILAAFAIVIVPLSLLAARFAIRKAKQEGSLIQY
jgi:ABC-2 type transport system permease protein